MAEAVAVPVSGFNIPALPASSAQSPGFVPPAATPPSGNEPQTFTAAQVAEQIAAAVAKAQPAPAPVQAAPAPAPANLSVDSGADPVLSSLTSIFAQIGGGLDIERALGNALSRGDASLIDTAYINEKGGAQAAQAATLAKAIVDRVASQTALTTAAVFETAGGQAQWAAASAVFDKNAPAHLKVVIAGLLESGNPTSIKAGAQSVMDYVKHNGLVMNPAQLISSSANVGGAQALSKDEFQNALFKLDKNSRTYLEDRNSLFARRAVGKQVNK